MTKNEILTAMRDVSYKRTMLIEQNYDLALAGDVEGAKALIPQIEELNQLFMDLYEKQAESA